MAHTLAGSGGTFGAYEITIKAKNLELYLKELITKLSENPEIISAQNTIDQIDGLFQSLKVTALEWKSSDVSNIFEDPNQLKSNKENNLIFIVEDDQLLADEIGARLKEEGYAVEIFNSIKSFEKACESSAPAAVLMDMVFSESDMTGAKIIQKLNAKNEFAIPVIFISVRNDIEARLDAAKAGAVRYFTKPVDVEKLKRTLEGLTSQKPKEPFRVLLIDDDENLLSFYRMTLERVGMNVVTIQNPLETLDSLVKFNPDIVVSDVYMPQCTGPELAQVIRQDDTYAQMPFMFLSTETDLGRQLAAVNLGGDDFLIKPVQAEHLIAAITARVKRSRWIKQLNLDLKNALRESKYRHITLDQHAIVAITDTEGKILDVNDKFLKAGDYRRADLIGSNLNKLKSDHHSRDFYLDIFKHIKKGRVWHGIISNKKYDGSILWMDSTVVPFLNENGEAYQYVWAFTDITQLRNSREEAEQANRAKSQFLSSMSHELRTPLNAIIGFSQLLKVDAKPDFKNMHIENIDEIIKAGNHLLQLINEILDLSKIESGRIELSIEAVPLGGILSECMNLIMPIASKREITLSAAVNSSVMDMNQIQNMNLHVRADYTRLKQVIINLMSNAVKYNSEKGSVIINIEEKDNSLIRISIQDTGPGLTENQIKQLFTAFNRLGRNDSSEEGTGIGLVITKNLVEMMAGSIGVSSVYGEGSSFWVDMPKDFIQKVISDKEQNQPVSSPPALSREYSILHVEDNPSTLRLVTQILSRRSNIHLHSSHNPLLALEMAEARTPDIILLDINLPEMDGYDFLKILRTQKNNLLTPVIAISANALQDDISRGMNAGFIDYITKPIDIENFLNIIDAVLVNLENQKL